MNTRSPLVPQSSFLEQKNKGRARVKIAVFIVLAIHGIGLLALLMQGCKKEPEAVPPVGSEDTNAPVTGQTAFADQTNAPPPFTAPTSAPVATTVTTNVEPPVAPPVFAATEYKVLKGDNYTTIARNFHTTTKALMDANPGVDPTKLQIGQTLHIPPPSPAAVAGATSGLPVDASAGEVVYSVQSGDTLIKIADKFKVSVRAIRAANPGLTTDRIKVGQKLKIPAKPAAPATGTTTPTGGSTTPPQ